MENVDSTMDFEFEYNDELNPEYTEKQYAEDDDEEVVEFENSLTNLRLEIALTTYEKLISNYAMDGFIIEVEDATAMAESAFLAADTFIAEFFRGSSRFEIETEN